MPAVIHARVPGAPRYSLLTIVAFTLLVLGLLRASILVLNVPLLGYGDQGDMHRTADCIGLQPLENVTRTGELPRPQDDYHTAGINWQGCYPGSSVLFVAPVALVFGIASLASDEPEIVIPLKAFGVFNLALVAALSLVVAFALRPNPVASVVHAALFFLIVCDPVSTLWLNTLHTEPAVLLGTYGAIGMATLLALRRENRALHWWLLGISFALLGFSREQFAYLPLALMALGLPVLRRRNRRKAMLLLALTALIAVAQVLLGPLRPDYVSPMNRVNAYLGVMLSTSANEEATLEELGLPGRCAAMAGASWQERRGENLDTVCPEAQKLSSIAFLKLLPSEPMTLLRAVSRVLPAAETIVPGYLGIASEGRIRSISDLPPRAMSFVALLSSIPAMVYSMTIMILLIAFPAVIAWCIWTVRTESLEMAALPLAFTWLIAIGGYSLATTAFGEGIAGAERHHWIGSLAMLSAIGLLPLVIWQLSRDWVVGSVALVVGLAIVLLASGWLLWSRSQPMAIGAMDKLGLGPGNVLEVGGWALDPWGVRRVYVSVGGGPETEGVRGIERRDLEALYPGYPEAVSGGFQITIPPNTWRENQRMRIFVENRSGGVTEIDRRQIRLKH
jgi:hypothetical protein